MSRVRLRHHPPPPHKIPHPTTATVASPAHVPNVPHITDRVQDAAAAAAAAVPAGTVWLVTPKVHGTNTSATVVRGDADVHFGPQNAVCRSVFARWAKGPLQSLLDVFPAATKVTVFGELYGGLWPGVVCEGAVQREVLYGPDRRFVAFDVAVDDVFLPFYDARQVVRRVLPGMVFIPVMHRARDLADAAQWAAAHADDNAWRGPDQVVLPLLCRPNPGEGWVVRPVTDAWHENARVLVKVTGRVLTEENPAAAAGPAGAAAEPPTNPYLTLDRITSVLSKQSQAVRTSRNIKALAEAVRTDVAAEGWERPPFRDTCAALARYFSLGNWAHPTSPQNSVPQSS